VDIFLIIGLVLVVAVVAHELRLKRRAETAKREGREAADYAALAGIMAADAHLRDGTHDHASHMDAMGPGDGMGGE